MSTLVTGATGFIGRHLVTRLLAESRPLRVLTRSPEKLSAEWSNRVEVISGSLLDPAVLDQATQGATTIFHLAGEIRNPELMEAVNASAVKSLLDAAISSGVKQFIHLSSVGVVGAEDPGEITEDAVCRPKNEYEQTKLSGEQEVLKRGKAGEINAVVLRPTIVFGEGSSNDSVLGWLRAVQQGRFFFIDREAIANYVYVGDVIEAMVHVTGSSSATPEIFNVADPASIRDFVTSMAGALGVAVPTKSLPVVLANTLGSTLETANRFFKTPAPLTRARVRALSSKTVFTGDKLKADGFSLPFGYQAGLRRTVEWYRQTGRL